jgi:hypothetical protein
MILAQVRGAWSLGEILIAIIIIAACVGVVLVACRAFGVPGVRRADPGVGVGDCRDRAGGDRGDCGYKISPYAVRCRAWTRRNL